METTYYIYKDYGDDPVSEEELIDIMWDEMTDSDLLEILNEEISKGNFKLREAIDPNVLSELYELYIQDYLSNPSIKIYEGEE